MSLTQAWSCSCTPEGVPPHLPHPMGGGPAQSGVRGPQHSGPPLVCVCVTLQCWQNQRDVLRIQQTLRHERDTFSHPASSHHSSHQSPQERSAERKGGGEREGRREEEREGGGERERGNEGEMEGERHPNTILSK